MKTLILLAACVGEAIMTFAFARAADLTSGMVKFVAACAALTNGITALGALIGAAVALFCWLEEAE